ncbi:hypothetical protein HNR39_000578 [Glaciimonas immobilis]|uniref:Uncharacterized protein n=1 Tax=Glaciimonas immobilis TaxID=728004 RepID=A0A840RP93_9BURK|nr:hypothetical protein [Glaciimonas immobilis]
MGVFVAKKFSQLKSTTNLNRGEKSYFSARKWQLVLIILRKYLRKVSKTYLKMDRELSENEEKLETYAEITHSEKINLTMFAFCLERNVHLSVTATSKI